MNPPFFITGLPRSRTAWLANLFTTGESLCFHEPTQTPTELLTQHLGVWIGIADCTLPFNFAVLSKVYPGAPWLYVDRDPLEAKRSLIKFTAPAMRLLGRDVDYMFKTHGRAAPAVKAHPGTLVVPYQQIDGRLEQIWKHLLPAVPFCPARAELLRGLKVEQHFLRALARRGMTKG